MKKYTSIFFDLDDTLLDFKAAERCAVTKVLAAHSLPHDEAHVKKYSEINQSYWEKFERGEIEKSEIFAGRFKTFLAWCGSCGDPEKIAKDYFLALSNEHQTMNGSHEILRLLRERGYKIYATTNGLCTTQFKRIKDSELEPLFDAVFVSEEACAQKPEKEYFDFVISHIPEKNKDNILVIGDSLSSDILGGINSGLDTCWFNPHGKKTDYSVNFEIRELSDLENILK